VDHGPAQDGPVAGEGAPGDTGEVKGASAPKPWLSVTVHDRAARMLPGIERNLAGLGEVFSGVAASGTEPTDQRIFETLAAGLPLVYRQHPPGPDRIGWARRESLELALEAGAETVLYSDLDHILRWIEADRAELEACLGAQPEVGVLVVGRTAAAFAGCPARLRETEKLVNHHYLLMTGRDWDLMFALRRFSAPAAAAIVAHCQEDTIANDVVWPLLAERLDVSLGYFAAEGLSYLTTADFDQDADRRDADPRGWIQRLEIAAGHARAMAEFLEPVAG
jgi:hypothetical protein